MREVTPTPHPGMWGEEPNSVQLARAKDCTIKDENFYSHYRLFLTTLYFHILPHFPLTAFLSSNTATFNLPLQSSSSIFHFNLP
jgi:hypothetical protein